MFSDSKSPFAAAPSNGSAPSPFQPAAANGSATVSPFGAAVTTSLPEAKQAPATPDSPFAVNGEVKEAAVSPFEPAIVEPTEGFAASEAVPPQPRIIKPAQVAPAVIDAASSPAPVAMPGVQAVSANRNDPFAAPATSSTPTPAGRTDFVLPSEGAPAAVVQAAPIQQAAAQVAPAPAAAPAPVAAVTGETSQLVLRAIFGVARELDSGEILQRARTLPGIRNLHVVGQNEGAAMSSLRDSIQRMGFGDQTSLTLTTNGGVVDFIQEPGTTLAVLHEGVYAAGVRETLIIVARELARLG